MKNLKKVKSKDILAKSKNKIFTTQKGITLIALVITIIILLILAAVTIAALSGDNGILSNAAKAKEETEKAEIIEQIRLDIYGEMADNQGKDPTEADIERIADNYGDISGTSFDDKILTTEKGNYEIKLSDIWSETSGNGSEDPTDPPSTTLQPGEIATAEKNEYYDAEADKTAKIPEGFRVSDKTGETSINGGLVVYAPDNSEYVWIPVDGILDEDGTISDVTGSEKKILLGRYDFAEDGTPSKYTSTDFKEDTPESHDPDYKNKIATDIEEGFIQSVRDNKGYYIARYEAGVTGYDADNIQTSNSNSEPSWTGYSEELEGSLKLVSKAGEQPWNYVTQNRASELCQNLYIGVNSDLVNSYAWDTAILFIQKYSGDTDYSRQDGLSTTSQLANTGEGKLADTADFDNPCNIYDMAGNCLEWTTETCSSSRIPCVGRGGGYLSSSFYTSGRYGSFTTSADSSVSFRPLLYL